MGFLRAAARLDKINRLLAADLEAPLVPLGPRGEHFIQTYQTQWGVIQFHLGGPGLADFDAAEKRSVTRLTETDVPVRCLCTEDLLAAKRKAGRPQDQGDIAFLERKLAALPRV